MDARIDPRMAEALTEGGAAGRFVLNGRFLLQSITGVQRVAREALMAFDQMAAAGEIPAPRVLLPSKGDLVPPPELTMIRLERVGRMSGHLWEQIELPRHAGSDPLLCLGNTAPVLRLYQRGRPTVVMIHDLSYKYFPSAYSRSFRALYHAMIPIILRRAEHVVTVSHSEESSIRRHYPFLQSSDRLSYLQNGGIDDALAAEIRAEPVPAADTRGYGLYLGSLTRRKNAQGMLAAAIDYLRAWPEMRFVVIGQTPPGFEGVSMELPADLAHRFELRGQVNDTEEVHAACRGARFLVMPSYYEASPLPPIEAMTFGTPVVASRIPSLVERCGEAALYCDPDDTGSIRDAMDRLTGTPETWARMSAAARAQTARYSWMAQARGLVARCEAVR